ncbi:uncharacterized protein LOC116352917 isoform X1 [Oncorhynchus kisutch]|uniref:uncharacterized protein LOC116352917 isoform X1 n=1 Tax=Oncorhynchus kisutch TaxID=8019 RepID=UPI0012DFD937|nr:uncharacterized protein LOC116352917 isoform X1 [Oncorhynchus kisutch]
MLERKRKHFCRPSANTRDIHHKSTTTQDDPIGTGMDNGVFDDNRSQVKQFSCHERHQGNDRTKVQRVSRQTLSESDFVHFPQINDTEVLTCECSSRSCQTVFWFRTLHNNLDIQFLLSLNNAGRTSHEPSVDEHRFKASKRDGGSKITFTLRLINISSEDAGLYTCMLQNQKENELWRPGVLLRPGGESNPFPCMALTLPILLMADYR